MIKTKQFVTGTGIIFDEFADFYKYDFDRERVVLHRSMFLDFTKSENNRIESIDLVVDILKSDKLSLQEYAFSVCQVHSIAEDNSSINMHSKDHFPTSGG